LPPKLVFKRTLKPFYDHSWEFVYFGHELSIVGYPPLRVRELLAVNGLGRALYSGDSTGYALVLVGVPVSHAIFYFCGFVARTQPFQPGDVRGSWVKRLLNVMILEVLSGR